MIGTLLRRFLAGSCLLLSPVVTWASPESTMEARALGFVQAMGQDREETYLEFRRDNLTTPEPDGWREVYDRVGEWGPFDVEGIDFFSPTEIQILARGQGVSDTIVFTFLFEASETRLIEEVNVSLGDPPSRGPELPALELSRDLDAATLTAALDRWLGVLAGEDLFSGALTVVRDGETLYSGAFGLANKSFAAPNTPATRFRVGSITKSFTKVALARLVLEGKIRPQDTIADHLPDYPNPEVAAKVTVDQLASHTSGLGGMNFAEFRRQGVHNFREPADFIGLFAHEPLRFEPGEGENYSNAGYIVLGAILAAAADMPYAEVIRETVFKPAGMTESDFLSLDLPHRNIATGYWHCREDREVWCNNTYLMTIQGSPAGGSFSTAMDLVRFDTALRTNTLLPAAYTHWYFSGEWPVSAQEPAPGSWPAGGIAGGAEGVSAVLISDGSVIVSVLSNYDEPSGEDVGVAIWRALKP